MRYIIKYDGQYVQFISWAGIVVPNFRLIDHFDLADIFDDDFLNFKRHEKVDRTTKELILDKYPEAKFIRVKVIEIEN